MDMLTPTTTEGSLHISSNARSHTVCSSQILLLDGPLRDSILVSQPKMSCESPSNSNPIPKPKREHKKSRNGCAQCKKRKVKCDERRPLCGNCSRHFENIHKCDFGPLIVKSSADSQLVSKPPKPSPLLKRPTGIRRQLMSPALVRGPGSGLLDPFKQYPIASNSNVPSVDVFMHHYFSHFEHKVMPMVLNDQRRKTFSQMWWDLASEDPVLFHATLQLSALDLDSLTGGKETLQSKLLLNKECITLLRERVEDPVLGTSDSTIGTVLFLAIVEFERGNLRMVKMHVEGLKRIIALRGGLAGVFSTNQMLANIIFGITMTLMTEPQFQPDTIEPAMSDEELDLWTGDCIFRYENLGLSNIHSRTLREMRHVTKQTEITWPEGPAAQNCSDVLLRLSALPVPYHEGPVVQHVSETCRIAAGLLCFLPFKNEYPSPTLMINVQLHKLKASLERMLEVVRTDHMLLPWLLSVGGIFAMAPERNWFAGQLVIVASDMNINSWEEMKAHLVDTIWIEQLCDTPFREFWEEVSLKRNTLELVALW